MSTVAQLADRTLAQFLRPPDDQPVILTLTASADESTTDLSYDDATLAPDEEELLGPGVLIEIGTELCRVTDSSFDGNTLTVIRGVSGTTPSAHANGAEVTVGPTVTRAAVVEAVCDQVVSLYPTLWHIGTDTVTATDEPVDVAAEVATVTGALWQNGNGRWYHAPLPDLLDPFPPSATGKAVQFSEVPRDHDVHLTYRAKFARPSVEADDLEDFGVETQWERIVAVGAAAQVVALRPSDNLTAEYVVEQLERESTPPGVSTDVRNGLLTLRDIWLREAQGGLRADHETAVTYRPIVRR